jgi:diguanylate cyclase (GGDEF)-like protein/PAS domain S-box-containing protein
VAAAGPGPPAGPSPSSATDLVFDALDSPIAVLDASGRIVAVNAAWSAHAEATSPEPWKCGVGASYLAVCDRATGPGTEEIRAIGDGIRSVLAGEAESFAVDYPCPAPGKPRWFNLRVSPLHGDEGGAVLIHHDVTELRQAELSARLDDARLIRAFDESSPVFLLVEPDGTIAFVSERTSELLGIDRERALGELAFDFVDPADRGEAELVHGSVGALPGSRARLRGRVIDGFGRRRLLDLSVVNLLDDPDVRAIAITGTDVTDTRLHEIASRLEGRLLHRFPASVVVMDDAQCIVYWNARAAEVTGVPAERAVGRRLDELGLRPADPEAARDVVAALGRGSGRWEGSYDVSLPDGRLLPLHTVLERVDDDDIDFHGVVIASIDVTERRELEQELAFQALHDPLTGLPNRRGFVDRIERFLRDGGESRAAVAFIDLDDFKELNDRVGHAAGDEALRMVARRIEHALREGDVVARIGGDEFVVGLPGVTGPEEVMVVAERVLEALRSPFSVEHHRVHLGASIGVAMSQEDLGAEIMLRNADAAMYQAKELGKNRIALFDDELRVRTRARRAFADRLRDAVDLGRIHAHFQPQICLGTGELVGFEALARWEGDVTEFEDSAAFLAVADEGGVAAEIDRLVLAESCTMLSRFRSERPDVTCSVSVNVSGELLADETFPDLVAELVHDAGIPARLLCIEVVESVLADVEAVADNLLALEELGVEFAVDDFGTGYSSLSRIQQLRVDYRKIDRSFVAGLGAGDDRDVVVAAIIGLAKGLGLRTIAEGVESDEQLRRLIELGVDIGQGFGWSRAVADEAAMRMVREAPPTERPCWAPAGGAPVVAS